MADSEQWLSQSDFHICISILVEFYLYMLSGLIFKIVLKNYVGQMKEKTYFSTFAFLIFFSPYRVFNKIGVDTHPIDLSCHQKFEKNSPTGSRNIGTRSWKYGKSHGRLDHSTHARSCARGQCLCQLSSHACETTGVPSRRILCEKAIFFRSMVLRVTRKNNQNKLDRVWPFVFALTCHKIYLNMHNCNVLWLTSAC